MLHIKHIILLILSLIHFCSIAQNSSRKSSYCDTLNFNIDILKSTLDLPEYLNINSTIEDTFSYNTPSISISKDITLYCNTIAVNRQDNTIKRPLNPPYQYKLSPQGPLNFNVRLPKTHVNIILNWDYYLYFYIIDDSKCSEENTLLIKSIPLIDSNYNFNSSLSIKYYLYNNGVKSNILEHKIVTKNKKVSSNNDVISFPRTLQSFQLKTLNNDKKISQTTLQTIYLNDNDEIHHYHFSFKGKSQYDTKLTKEEEKIFHLINKPSLLTGSDKKIKKYHLDIYVFKRDGKIINIDYIKKGDDKYGSTIIEKGYLQINPD